jgi:hypothetical protein
MAEAILGMNVEQRLDDPLRGGIEGDPGGAKNGFRASAERCSAARRLVGTFVGTDIQQLLNSSFISRACVPV